MLTAETDRYPADVQLGSIGRRRRSGLLPRPTTVLFAAGAAVFFALSVLLQIVRDSRASDAPVREPYLYVSSGPILKRLTQPFNALAADVYWIRALQHYGGTKRSQEREKSYALLYPLLDIATTLDPRFSIAYRFGAIFLTEAYPNGPGRPDLAIALLEKGHAANPGKWQYLQDIGFVHYWWHNDYVAAATWFQRASELDGAPWWLKSLAAVTLARGGDRRSSRLMWEQLANTADNDWLKREAERRLVQLQALDEIDRLRWALQEYAEQHGAFAESWDGLVRAGYLKGWPADPTGHPYLLDARMLAVRLSTESPLFPLPSDPPVKPATVP